MDAAGMDAAEIPTARVDGVSLGGWIAFGWLGGVERGACRLLVCGAAGYSLAVAGSSEASSAAGMVWANHSFSSGDRLPSWVDVLLGPEPAVAGVPEDRDVALLVDAAVARVAHDIAQLADDPAALLVDDVAARTPCARCSIGRYTVSGASSPPRRPTGRPVATTSAWHDKGSARRPVFVGECPASMTPVAASSDRERRTIAPAPHSPAHG